MHSAVRSLSKIPKFFTSPRSARRVHQCLFRVFFLSCYISQSSRSRQVLVYSQWAATRPLLVPAVYPQAFEKPASQPLANHLRIPAGGGGVGLGWNYDRIAADCVVQRSLAATLDLIEMLLQNAPPSTGQTEETGSQDAEVSIEPCGFSPAPFLFPFFIFFRLFLSPIFRRRFITDPSQRHGCAGQDVFFCRYPTSNNLPLSFYLSPPPPQRWCLGREYLRLDGTAPAARRQAPQDSPAHSHESFRDTGLKVLL